MTITPIKNENNVTVYHVVDDGCVHEFWTYKEAKEYVTYVKSVEE